MAGDRFFDLLAVCGLVFLLTESRITKAPRLWIMGRSRTAQGLLLCAFCTGVWAGAAVWGAWALPPWAGLVADGVKFALAGAWVAFLGHLVVRVLERHAGP